jgi:hypothetical protein
MPKAFSLLAFAASAVVASRLAHDVMYHGVTLMSLKVVLTGFVVLVVAICVAPLLALAGPLAAAKRRALLEYGALVGKHGRLVRQRWILGEAPADDALLQAPEIGPVADTMVLYEAVARMRCGPCRSASPRCSASRSRPSSPSSYCSPRRFRSRTS